MADLYDQAPRQFQDLESITSTPSLPNRPSEVPDPPALTQPPKVPSAFIPQKPPGGIRQQVIPERGFMTDIDDPRRSSMSFWLNPSMNTDSQRTNYADLDVIGISHPVKQYVSGGSRKVDFTLAFDRGLRTMESKSIEFYFRWLEHFKYPQRGEAGLEKPPPRILLKMGPWYDGLIFVLVDLAFRITERYPDLTIRKAEADVSLEEIVDFSKDSRSLWDSSVDQGDITGDPDQSIDQGFSLGSFITTSTDVLASARQVIQDAHQGSVPENWTLSDLTEIHKSMEEAF